MSRFSQIFGSGPLTVIALVLLAGCEAIPALTAQQAVAEYINKGNPDGVDMRIVPDSIEVLQMQPFQGKTLVLVAYNGTDHAGQTWDCLGAYAAQGGVSGWRVSGGGGGCSQDSPLGGGSWQGELAVPTSIAYGQVPQQVKTVVLTWEDGQEQQMPVASSSYLFARAGTITPQLIEGFDKDGRRFWTTQ